MCSVAVEVIQNEAGGEATCGPSLLPWASILSPDKAASSLSPFVLTSTWIFKENCLFQPSKAPNCETQLV